MGKYICILSLILSANFGSAAPVVVLIPGAGSSGDQVYLDKFEWAADDIGTDYFGKYQKELSKSGIANFVCPKDPDQDRRHISERALACVQAILADRNSDCSRREVILVGHSMGGLIARVVANDDRVKKCIYSVTTISTPHRGTVMADFAIDHSYAASDIYGDIVRYLDFTVEQRPYLPELRSDRTAAPPETFMAQDIPDVADIQYYSFSSSMPSIPIKSLDITRKIISAELHRRSLSNNYFGDANDGMVPEYSMLHGTYLGHLESDHWSTACADPVRKTNSCQRSLAQILPHLKTLASKAQK